MSRAVGATARLVLVGTIVVACGGAGKTGGSAPAAVTKRVAETTGKANVTVELPAGWHAGTPDDGNIIDPLTRVVASSAPVRLRGVQCQIARFAPGRADVTLVVVEWGRTHDASFPPRPARFTAETFELRPAPAIECFGGRGGTVQFADGGRTFGAYLLAGEDASDRLVEQAIEILSTLKVGRSEDQCSRESRPGPWAACGEAEWVRRVVEAGGYRVVGETGSALVAEGGGRSFYIWTTLAPRNPRTIVQEDRRPLAVVAGVSVYGDRDLWRFWQAQGFVLWVQEGPSASSVVPSPAELEEVVEASRLVPAPR